MRKGERDSGILQQNGNSTAAQSTTGQKPWLARNLVLTCAWRPSEGGGLPSYLSVAVLISAAADCLPKALRVCASTKTEDSQAIQVRQPVRSLYVYVE